MFAILTEIVDFIWKAIVVYASSDQGKAELEDIAQALENAGIDVPFWQPEGEQPLDMAQEGSPAVVSDAFRKRHPELFVDAQGEPLE